MKRNIFLRLAVCLLLAAVMGTSVFTVSLAKYVAAAGGVADPPRVAKFSFVTGSRKYLGSGWEEQNTAIDAGAFGGYDPSKQFREIAVSSGAVTSFEMPLFDFEYLSPVKSSGSGLIWNWFNGPLPPETTVTSKNGQLVAAPGTGLNMGQGKNNPNAPHNNNAEGAYHTFQFRNDSEVAVRYKLSIVSTAADLQNVPIYVYAPAKPGAGWELAVGAVMTGSSALAEWNMLPPGGSDELKMGWFWAFDKNGYGWDPSIPHNPALELFNYSSYYGSNVRDWLATLSVNTDADDTLLGYYAAEYLRALAADNDTDAEAALAECQFNLVFKLEVEQID